MNIYWPRMDELRKWLEECNHLLAETETKANEYREQRSQLQVAIHDASQRLEQGLPLGVYERDTGDEP